MTIILAVGINKIAILGAKNGRLLNIERIVQSEAAKSVLRVQ